MFSKTQEVYDYAKSRKWYHINQAPYKRFDVVVLNRSIYKWHYFLRLN